MKATVLMCCKQLPGYFTLHAYCTPDSGSIPKFTAEIFYRYCKDGRNLRTVPYEGWNVEMGLDFHA